MEHVPPRGAHTHQEYGTRPGEDDALLPGVHGQRRDGSRGPSLVCPVMSISSFAQVSLAVLSLGAACRDHSECRISAGSKMSRCRARVGPEAGPLGRNRREPTAAKAGPLAAADAAARAGASAVLRAPAVTAGLAAGKTAADTAGTAPGPAAGIAARAAAGMSAEDRAGKTCGLTVSGTGALTVFVTAFPAAVSTPVVAAGVRAGKTAGGTPPGGVKPGPRPGGSLRGGAVYK